MSTLVNSRAEALGAGVATVEVAGTARGALVGHEVGVLVEHEVVDQRHLRRGDLGVGARMGHALDGTEPPHRFESDANRLTPRAACARMRRMPRSYKICSPFVPGVGGHDTVAGAVSDQLAANERVDNMRVVPLRRGADMRLRAAVERFKLWENGAHAARAVPRRRCPRCRTKVAAIAKEWEDGRQPHARLRHRPARPRSASASPRRGSRGRRSAPTPSPCRAPRRP